MESKKFFPYELREGQEDFLDFVSKAIKGSNALVSAATGFGKTPLILAAILPKALREGRKIIWAVRTGTETDRPIEELKSICQAKGKKIFGLSFRGKKDMCLLFRDKFRGEESATHEDVEYFCSRNREKCRYLMNLDSFLKSERVTRFEQPMLYSGLFDYCKREKICPYGLQSCLAADADVLALNYNYILSEGLRWGLKRKVDCSRAFLIVDEAHNLPNAASNFSSDQITLRGLNLALDEIEKICLKRRDVGEWVKAQIKKLIAFLQEVSEGVAEDTEFNPKKLISALGGYEEVEKLIDCARKFGNEIRREKLGKGKLPRSSLHHLSNFLELLLEKLKEDGIAFILAKAKGNLVAEVWNMKSREILAPIWPQFYRCIFCSGTLAPLDAFAEVVGIENYQARDFPSGFGEGSVTLITRLLTTRGEELEEKMARKYLRAIGKFLELKANVAIFSASYRIQSSLFQYGLEKIAKGKGRKLFVEREGMSGIEGRKILDGFKGCAQIGNGLLCATMTGRFAEGADFPGKELEGAFLVGIPFARMTSRTKVYLRYNERVYGEKKGRFYAYIFPALRRASQALGRVLRSKEDRGFFVLGDRRYARFKFLLPDFVQKNCRLSWPREIGKEVELWNKGFVVKEK